MGCIYHPEQENIAFCHLCEADLCESCAIRVEDGRTFCHRCMLAVSLEDVKTETSLKEEEEEDRRVGVKDKQRFTYIQSVLVVGAVLILILTALRLHWSQTEFRPQTVLPATASVELLAALQQALAHYAAEHGNRYPDGIYELTPDYLANVAENRRILGYISYERDESEGYRLQIKPGSLLSDETLVATALGIHPVRREE